MTKPSPIWAPDRHQDRRPFLLARNAMMAALRSWFAAEGFVEIDPPALQVSPGNETHLHAFRTELVRPDGRGTPLYLHTSPEFTAKKLLAAGETRIVAFSHVYRNREAGALHAPEFTMVEWYRTGDAEEAYEAVIFDTLAIIAEAARAIDSQALTWRDHSISPFDPAERISVQKAFSQYAGIDLALIGVDQRRFVNAARAAGVRTAPDDTWSDIFSRIIVEKIEPALGRSALSVLCDYPISEASLARPKPGQPHLADRFELYACGVELANGFCELTDAETQRLRFEAEMHEKQRRYGETYPIDRDFLDALAIMPPAAGVALGFDRLAMLASGARHIDQVQWMPVQSGEHIR